MSKRFNNDRTIGEVGDSKTEEQVILIEHNIPTSEFTPSVIRCLPPTDWKITPENSFGRIVKLKNKNRT